jgi:hypothetical protein
MHRIIVHIASYAARRRDYETLITMLAFLTETNFATRYRHSLCQFMVAGYGLFNLVLSALRDPACDPDCGVRLSNEIVQIASFFSYNDTALIFVSPLFACLLHAVDVCRLDEVYLLEIIGIFLWIFSMSMYDTFTGKALRHHLLNIWTAHNTSKFIYIVKIHGNDAIRRMSLRLLDHMYMHTHNTAWRSAIFPDLFSLVQHENMRKETIAYTAKIVESFLFRGHVHIFATAQYVVAMEKMMFEYINYCMDQPDLVHLCILMMAHIDRFSKTSSCPETQKLYLERRGPLSKCRETAALTLGPSLP